MDEPIAQSPKPQEVAPVVPPVVEGEALMDFPEAIRQLTEDKKNY